MAEECRDEPAWEREAGEGWGPGAEIYLMLEVVVNPLSHTKVQCFASRSSVLANAKAPLPADGAGRHGAGAGLGGFSAVQLQQRGVEPTPLCEGLGSFSSGILAFCRTYRRYEEAPGKIST